MKLWENSDILSYMDMYLVDSKLERPAVLVIPGGGYGCVCEETEGFPIAQKFNELGLHAFVLNYRVAPNRFPAPQLDVIRAMKIIRHNVSRWNIDEKSIAVCGFSAGAHLAGSLGTIAQTIDINIQDEIDTLDFIPNAMILCYGVLCFEKWSHQGSINNLLGENSDIDPAICSLEKNINDTTPPSFVWHTYEDQMVSYRNSTVFAEAMWKMNRICELHVFPHGPHGMQLGYGRKDIEGWPQMAANFLQTTCGFKIPEIKNKKTVILTFDDAVKSHLSNVAPVLMKYNFGATFFICRFNDDWRATNNEHLLDIDEISQLQKLGFEIGNHTETHPDLRNCNEKQCCEEIENLNDFLNSANIVKPVSFAYPGGPYAENTIPSLEKNGITLARTTEQRPWQFDIDSLYRIPSYPLQKDDELAFYSVISKCTDDNAIVLVFHGIPDMVHEFVSTSLPFFEKCMKYLHDNDFNVLSMKSYYEIKCK